MLLFDSNKCDAFFLQGVLVSSALLVLGGAAAINTFINLNQEFDIQDDQDAIDDLLKRVSTLESRRKFLSILNILDLQYLMY